MKPKLSMNQTTFALFGFAVVCVVVLIVIGGA